MAYSKSNDLCFVNVSLIGIFLVTVSQEIYTNYVILCCLVVFRLQLLMCHRLTRIAFAFANI